MPTLYVVNALTIFRKSGRLIARGPIGSILTMVGPDLTCHTCRPFVPRHPLVDRADVPSWLLTRHSTCATPPESSAASATPIAIMDSTAGPGRLSWSKVAAAYPIMTL